MTTNQDRATQIINAKLIESCYPEDIAQALADAGLLTPDPIAATPVPLEPGNRADADKLRAVLARLDREYAAVAASNPGPSRDEAAAGYLAGIDTAHKWLTQALEGAHE